MGWTLSPPYFCAATETGRDVAEWLRVLGRDSCPKHKFEDEIMEQVDQDLLNGIKDPKDWDPGDFQDYIQRIH